MTGKERAKLRSLAQTRDPLIQLGKNGLNEGFYAQLEALLDDHELVKINILKNSPLELEEVRDQVLDKTGAILVQAMGSKLTIYRQNLEEPIIDLG